MNLNSLANSLRMAGVLVVVASITRAVTLMQVFNSWSAETAGFWSEDWTVSNIACTQEVVNAVCFSKVTSDLVRSRVLSHYYDQSDSLPTLVGLIAGLSLCLLAKLIVVKQADHVPT